MFYLIICQQLFYFLQLKKSLGLGFNMTQNSETETPNSQLLNLQSSLLELSDRAMLQIVMTLSMEQTSRRHCKKDNGLSSRFSKQIQNMKMTKSSQKCTICLSEFCSDQIIKKFPCKHIFHRDCAKSWLKVDKNCPNCRFDLQKHFQTLESQGKLTSTSSGINKEGKLKQKLDKNLTSRTQLPKQVS